MGAEAVAIVGPTACGKTHRAVMLARSLGGEIISADSRQVYVGMTVGSGKDLDEYAGIPYHLIDIAQAGEKYNLHRYLSDFRAAYDDILLRGAFPVICGGTGMYVENALAGVRLPDVPPDPELRAELAGLSLERLTQILAGMKSLHNTTDVDTPARAIRAIEIQRYYESHPQEAAESDRSTASPLNCAVIGIDIPRDMRRAGISRRLRDRLDNGLVEEIGSLLAGGLSAADLIYYGLEYKYVTLYVTGAISRDEMFRQLETAIHQFAKRQMTWFRGMEKRGIHIHWLPYDLPDEDFIACSREIIAGRCEYIGR